MPVFEHHSKKNESVGEAARIILAEIAKLLRVENGKKSDEIGLGIELPISKKLRTKIIPIESSRIREIRRILNSVIVDARAVSNSVNKNPPDELKSRLKMIAELMKKVRAEVESSAGNVAVR